MPNPIVRTITFDGVTYDLQDQNAAPSTHSHGNITSSGTLQTTDITIANGDKLVVTDSSDSNKVARTSISFDASTDSKVLSKKGTWVDLPSGVSPYTSNPEMDGTASAGSSTLYAKGDHVHPTDTSRAASSHTHGNITNGGDITATAPTIASGDQIIINDNSASKITNGPTFDGSTTTTALTPKGTWETFSKFSGSYNDLTDKPTITDENVKQSLSTSNSQFCLLMRSETGTTNSTAGTYFSSSIKVIPNTGDLKVTKINGVEVGNSPKFTDSDTTYTLSNALSSHKFTETLTAGGSGSGTSTATMEFVAGTGISLTDDTTNKKITIASTLTVPTKTSDLTNDSNFVEAFKVTLSYSNGTYTIDKTTAQVEDAILAGKYVYLYDATQEVYDTEVIIGTLTEASPQLAVIIEFYAIIQEDYGQLLIQYVIEEDTDDVHVYTHHLIESVNNKTGNAITLTASDVGAAASDHTHTTTLATDTGTSSITLASAGKYKLTAGGTSVIFTMPTIPTVSYPVTSVNTKTGDVTLSASDVGALATTGGEVTGDITLKADAATNSKCLIFQRGTLSDNYNDWMIQDRSGFLYFDERGNGSTAWTNRVCFNTSGNVQATTFNNYYLQPATYNTTSLIKPWFSTTGASTLASGSATAYSDTPSVNARTTTAGRYYALEIDKNGRAYTNVPWESGSSGLTSVGLTNDTNGGLSISGSPLTSNGTITIGHSNVLASAQATQAVYPIAIDKNGHISSYGTAVTIPTKTSDLTNDGDGTSNFARMSDIGSLGGGTITKVKTTAGAHTTIDVSSGDAEFNVPTHTSHLTNDSGFVGSLIGSTSTLTPTQVLAALQAGKTVYISHTVDTDLTIYATYFDYASSLLMIVSNVIVNYLGSYYVYVLSGTTYNDVWTVSNSTLAQSAAIPTSAFNATTGISIADHSTTTIYGVSGSTSVYGVKSGTNSTTTASKVTLSGSDSFSATVSNHVLSFSHSATAVSASDVTVPIRADSATTVPTAASTATTVVTSATHSITDNGHTHSLTN